MPNSIADDLAHIADIDVVPKILEVVCRTTGMGFAAVARVTSDRWVACAVQDEIAFGLKPGGELQLATTICDEIRNHHRPVVIDHVAKNESYRSHPTPRLYGFQSYISVPIFAEGEFFGTLCAIDPRPARVEAPEVLAMFELFGDLIGQHLDSQQQLARSRAALLDERAAAALREEFIAILGHDLRNPLASISAGLRMLLKTPLDDKALSLTDLMQSSVGRMAGLINNVLDLARGRLGGGIDVDRQADPHLDEALRQVVAELRSAQPHRAIEADVTLDQAVVCDSGRIAQLLSNLLANALTHGSDRAPVRVRARAQGGQFELSVANAGDAIPAERLDRLFQPFTRASVRPSQEGLGLGLYIAAEIARAHGGALGVQSTGEETCFTFRMPLTPALA